MNSEDLDGLLIEALDMENGGLFMQGDVIVSGIANNLPRRYVYGRFAYLSRRGLRTAKQRHKVSAIFTADKRNPELNWTFHSLCASVADLRKPETWNKAYEWLDRAAGTIANDREYSTEDLANDMKATGNDPNADKPVYLLDKVEGLFEHIQRPIGNIELTAITIHVPREYYEQLSGVEDAEVIITIVQKVQEVAQQEA